MCAHKDWFFGRHYLSFSILILSFYYLISFYTNLLAGLEAQQKRGNCKYLKITFNHNIGVLLVFISFIIFCTIMSTNVYFVASHIISSDEVFDTWVLLLPWSWLSGWPASRLDIFLIHRMIWFLWSIKVNLGSFLKVLKVL